MRALDILPAVATEPVLLVRALRKSFARGLARAQARTFALQDVDLTLSYGELVCVAGPEGSGKTALLQCAAGLLKRDGGTVKWFGESLTPGSLPDAVSYVPAVPVYYPFLTIRDVMQIRESRTHDVRPLAVSMRESLALLELDVRIDCQIADLTRDELRCLSIAEAVSRNPLVILLDTSPGEQRAFPRTALSALRKFSEGGGTVMIAARDAVAVAECATRIVMLHEGMIRRSFYWDSMLPVANIQPPLLLAETLH
jgi:ABC-type multidrug transport system ATPase subunit